MKRRHHERHPGITGVILTFFLNNIANGRRCMSRAEYIYTLPKWWSFNCAQATLTTVLAVSSHSWTTVFSFGLQGKVVSDVHYYTTVVHRTSQNRSSQILTSSSMGPGLRTLSIMCFVSRRWIAIEAVAA